MTLINYPQNNETPGYPANIGAHMICNFPTYRMFDTPYFSLSLTFKRYPMNTTPKKHHGHSIKRIREIQQIKQKTVADFLSTTLNESWDQSKVSLLEDKEEIEDKLLAVIAQVLNVTPDIIKDFNADAAVNIITNNNSGEHSFSINNNQYNINPVDKLVEVYDELLKAKDELLKVKDELIKVKDELIAVLRGK